MTLTDSERTEIRGLLEELAAKLEARMETSGDQADPVQLDEPIGRLSRMDAIQMQQMAKAGMSREERQLALARYALRLIDEKDFEYDEVEFQESLPEIRLKLRAQISRVKWGQQGESRALAEEDPQILKALEVFDEAKRLQADGVRGLEEGLPSVRRQSAKSRTEDGA